MSDHNVSLVNDSMQEFYVEFEGPKDSPYEGGLWRLHVELPDQYPYKSPSIGFVNTIFHPNIDERSGSICLDVINQTWSPMFDMINILDEFIPQLLSYPNASDPLNGSASSLYLDDNARYLDTVKSYVKKYADPVKVRRQSISKLGNESHESLRNKDINKLKDDEDDQESSTDTGIDDDEDDVDNNEDAIEDDEDGDEDEDLDEDLDGDMDEDLDGTDLDDEDGAHTMDL